jgi:hypothetical protein
MSVSPTRLLEFIAENKGRSLRTVRRWAADGKIPGVYRIRRGHFRFRRLPPNDVETVIKLQCATLLRELKVLLFPHFDEAMEYIYLREALKDPDPTKWPRRFEFQPQPFKELGRFLAQPQPKLAVKAGILQLHGYEVTNKNLAKILCIAPSTLYDRFGQKVVQTVCRETNSRPVTPIPTSFRWNRRRIWQPTGNDSLLPGIDSDF